MKELLIEIQDLELRYQNKVALRNASMQVHSGDFIGIIGPNGGGKSTLIKGVIGLLKPQRGRVIRHISQHEIGYLPQITQVDEKFPITVQEVVGSGYGEGLLSGFRQGKKSRMRTAEILEQVGISALASRAVGALSGGEFQRTLLARALISSPKLLVLDEPDTHVDNRFEMELYELLRELNSSLAILLVSHDLGTISSYVKSIACVNQDLHYHPSNEISEEQLKVYNCPIEVITHGTVPHRVMLSHEHD